MLDFARVERGRGAYELAVGDVGAVVSRAAQLLRYRAEREHVRLEVDVSSDLSECRIDDRALQLAVINLIDNAIKYGRANHGDEAESVVRVSVEQSGGSVVIRVTDDGPGIAKAERERIFERFVRGQAAKTGEAGMPIRGSGIGLALVRHIAESHGGTASVESDVASPRSGGPGKSGSTFVLTIPIATEEVIAIDGKRAQDIV